MDALGHVLDTVRRANGHGHARNRWVRMLALDVKNAFNCASWSKIMEALRREKVPPKLLNMLGAYLSDRAVIIRGSEGNTRWAVSCGVPQGSILGPDLWNVMYNGLLGVSLPPETELVAFADDVAILSTVDSPLLIEVRLRTAMGMVVEWITVCGLELAIQKTEVLLVTRRNHIEVTYGDSTFPSKSGLRYLGVVLDPRLNFGEHAERVSRKAAVSINALSRLMPNVGGPRLAARRLLASTVTSMLLYGAPAWAPTMCAKPMAKMEAVHRRCALRVACCYRTISYRAVCVVAGIPLFRLLADERLRLRLGDDVQKVKADTTAAWQTEWERASDRRLTYRLIPSIERWLNRKFGEVNFQMAQVLTGHGCFGTYRAKYTGAADDRCIICDEMSDNVFHAIFKCPGVHRWRWKLCRDLDIAELTPDNIVGLLLSSPSVWESIKHCITRSMKFREEVERRRERLPRAI